jgi:hypothetical protein
MNWEGFGRMLSWPNRDSISEFSWRDGEKSAQQCRKTDLITRYLNIGNLPSLEPQRERLVLAALQSHIPSGGCDRTPVHDTWLGIQGWPLLRKARTRTLIVPIYQTTRCHIPEGRNLDTAVRTSDVHLTWFVKNERRVFYWSVRLT